MGDRAIKQGALTWLVNLARIYKPHLQKNKESIRTWCLKSVNSCNRTRLLLFYWSSLLRESTITCLTTVKTLSLPPIALSDVQQVIVLYTCSVVTKFLSDEVNFLDEEPDTSWSCHLRTHFVVLTFELTAETTLKASRVKPPSMGECLFFEHTGDTIYNKQANFNEF